MKNAILFLMLVMLSITACERNNSNDYPNDDCCLPPKPAVEIIKFKKSEYKDYIMVGSPEETSTLLTLNTYYFAVPSSVFNLYGQSPYIDLMDDYLLIDWKWNRIFYQNNDAIITEKWAELKDLNTTYSLEKLYVNHPVAEYYWVEIDKIKECNGGYLEHDSVTPFWRTEYVARDWEKFPEVEKEAIIYWAEKTDRAFVEYTEILLRIISEGKLNQFGQKVELRKD